MYSRPLEESDKMVSDSKPKAFSFQMYCVICSSEDTRDLNCKTFRQYNACERYLTDDMRIAINKEAVEGFGALVSRLMAHNSDGTVARRDPEWGELFDFEIKFGEYLELKIRMWKRKIF